MKLFKIIQTIVLTILLKPVITQAAGPKYETLLAPSYEHRPAQVYLPENLNDPKQFPVVVFLHAYGASANTEVTYYLGLPQHVSEKGKEFILLVPQADYIQSEKCVAWHCGKEMPWDNGKQGNEREEQTIPDDNDYILRMLASLEARYPGKIDSNAIFAFGHSNGGFLAHALAARHPEKFAAIASLAGPILKNLNSDVIQRKSGSYSVSILHIHSEDDERVKYNGADFEFAGRTLRYHSAQESIEIWRKVNECSDVPITTEVELQTELCPWGTAPRAASVSYRNHLSGAEVTLWSFKKLGNSPRWVFGIPVDDPHVPWLSKTGIANILQFLFDHRRIEGT